MQKQGQGALEYLLLIGGAILVAVIVISILVGLGGTGTDQATQAAADALCAQKPANAANCYGLETIRGEKFCCNVSNNECRATATDSRLCAQIISP